MTTDTIIMSPSRVGRCNCAARPVMRRRPACPIRVNEQVKRPDLATYSQQEQLSLGNAPSWNSPDITTNGEIPFTLLAEASFVVRNLTSIPAMNALVTISTYPFGIGTPQTLGLSQKVSFGAGEQITILYPFSQAILAGGPRIGVQVLIEHPFDSKLINNQGQQAIDCRNTSASGRKVSFQFPVVNNTGGVQTISLEIQPNQLSAVLGTYNQAFGPLQQTIVTVTIIVPATLHGTAANPVYEEVTIIARLADQQVTGGVTLIALIDD